jgi:hypothetical protein
MPLQANDAENELPVAVILKKILRRELTAADALTSIEVVMSVYWRDDVKRVRLSS